MVRTTANRAGCRYRCRLRVRRWGDECIETPKFENTLFEDLTCLGGYGSVCPYTADLLALDDMVISAVTRREPAGIPDLSVDSLFAFFEQSCSVCPIGRSVSKQRM
jgi:hypothetical protein